MSSHGNLPYFMYIRIGDSVIFSFRVSCLRRQPPPNRNCVSDSHRNTARNGARSSGDTVSDAEEAGVKRVVNGQGDAPSGRRDHSVLRKVPDARRSLWLNHDFVVDAS